MLGCAESALPLLGAVAELPPCHALLSLVTHRLAWVRAGVTDAPVSLARGVGNLLRRTRLVVDSCLENLLILPRPEHLDQSRCMKQE